MGLTGNFADLDAFKAQVEKIGDGTAMKEIAAKVLPKIDALVDAEFASGTDPYGTPWTPTKNGGNPLQGGRGMVSVSMDGNGLSVTTNEIGGYHQTGTSRMPQRMVIPDEGRGFPPSWQAVLDAASTEVMESHGASKEGA
jgi:hypothetical protein